MEFTGERIIPEHNFGSETYLEHLNRYAFASQFIKDKVVLDIACGSGYGSDFLLRNGAQLVYGVDISAEAVAYCRKKNKDERLKFLVGSAARIPLRENSVDMVVSFETIEHMREGDQKDFLQEISRVLRPGGLLIMSTPNKKTSKGGNKYHLNELSEEDYNGLLGRHFKNNKFYFQNRLFCNYILDKKIDELSLDEEMAINNWSPMHTDDCMYLISVSSNGAIPEVKNKLSLIDVAPENKRQEEKQRLKKKNRILRFTVKIGKKFRVNLLFEKI